MAESSAPKWSDQFAAELKGKRVFIGFTYLDPNGQVERRLQMVGRVTAISPTGVTVELEGPHVGEAITLPPDQAAFRPATPGIYELHSVNECVLDPDFIVTWTVTRDPGQRPPHPTSLEAIDERVKTEPYWEDRLAQVLIGKSVIIGLLGATGTEHDQLYGEIAAVSRDIGVTVRLGGSPTGESFVIPANLRLFRHLPPGDFEIDSGETISDPDYSVTLPKAGTGAR